MNISQPNVQTTHQRVARAVVAHDVAEHLDHARRPKRLAWPENAEGSSSGRDAARGGLSLRRVAPRVEVGPRHSPGWLRRN